MRIGGILNQEDILLRPYPEHYQRGAGILPAFSGTVYQDGNGLGDILKSVARIILPILGSGAATFIKGTAHEISQGQSLGEAAKKSIAPTAKKIVGKAVKRVVQKGKGRRRRRRVYKSRKRKNIFPIKQARNHRIKKFKIEPSNF